MKKIFFIVVLFTIILHSEGLNTGSIVDPDRAPVFGSCTDLADVKKNKPVLLPTYQQPLPGSAEAAFSIKGPVDVDVRNGTIGYRVFSATNGDTVDKPIYYNKFCTQLDDNMVNQEVSQETQSVRDEVQRMYDSADAIYQQAQADAEQKNGGATTSDVFGQAMAGNVAAAQDAEKKMDKSATETSRNGMTSPHLAYMARINTVESDMQTFLYLAVVLVSLVAMGGGFITKKLQDRADHEDYVARIGLGLLLSFMLLSTTATYKYGNGEISQTRMQALWGWMLNKSTGWANVLSGAAHYEQMRSTINKTGGKEVSDQIGKAVRERAELENRQGAYEAVLKQCLQSYRVSDLAMAIGSEKGGGKRYFPTDESKVKIGEEDVYSRYLLPEVNQNDVFLSLGSCGKAEEEYRALIAQKKILQEKIEDGKNTKLQVRYTQSAKQIIGDTTTAGWTGIAMLPVHHFIAHGVGHNLESKPKQNTKEAEEETQGCDEYGEGWTMSNTFEKLGCYAEKLYDTVSPAEALTTIQSIDFDGYMRATAHQLPYISVPGASAVYTAIYDFVGDITDKVGLKFLGALFAFFVATELGNIVVNNLPFLVLIPSISIVIAFYHFEVFIYGKTIPFVAAYAFSRDQWGHLVRHAVRGVLIALKPVMIVISVYAALYVSDQVSAISKPMIEKQTALLLKDNSAKYQTVSLLDSIKNSVNLITKPVSTGPSFSENAGNAFSGFMGKFTIYIIEGFLFIIMAVVQVFIVVKIIISGPAMIMEMFGVRETDVASQMTESITANAKRYEGGI